MNTPTPLGRSHVFVPAEVRVQGPPRETSHSCPWDAEPTSAPPSEPIETGIRPAMQWSFGRLFQTAPVLPPPTPAQRAVDVAPGNEQGGDAPRNQGLQPPAASDRATQTEPSSEALPAVRALPYDDPYQDYMPVGRRPFYTYPIPVSAPARPRRRKAKQKKKSSQAPPPIQDVVPEPPAPPPKAKSAIDIISDLGGLPSVQADLMMYGHVSGYAYHIEWEIGDVSEGDSAEKAMSILQKRPDAIFPFGVDGTISEGSRVDLRAPLFPILVSAARFLDLDHNHCIVQAVSKTSFTFLTEEDHFDGAGSLITFTTFEKDGKVYLSQTGYAPNSGMIVGVGAMVGAPPSWAIQQYNLQQALEAAR